MANETKEIGDIVKKCKILLLDIEGTTTSISFVKDKLFPYAEENVQKFLESEWDKDDVKEAVVGLRKLALEDKDNKVDGVVEIPGEDASKDDQISGLVGSVKWLMSSDRKAGPLKQLQGLIWKQGYDNGDIKGHVYEDVAAALEQWRSTEGHKVYIYSSGSVQAQKLLFGQSLAGDLLPRIDGHFDTAVGAKQEAASYTAIVEKLDAKPEEIFFLTDIVKEAEAAREAGMHAALVSREGNAPLPEEAAASFPVIHSFTQLTASNKRKPDQVVEEETPAKVPKTDADKDVKATVEIVSAAPKEETKEEEKMEVETENTIPETPAEQEKEAEKIVTEIEEITDSNEPVDAPMVDIEPVVEEENKTEEKEKETDKEEVKTSNGESDSKPIEEILVKKVSENSPDSTEKPVIEEITNDNNSPLAEVADADIAEELAPIVEEPPATEDMEVLQNVGEVLVNECDDILSKVQDVTNLDSIPVKPLLNPIAEETMETENLDSNDIVDRILDSELELEMKQNEIVDSASTVENNKTKEEKSASEEAPTVETNGVDVEKPEADVESNKKIKDSSPTDASAESKSEETVETVAMETQVEDKQEAPITESKDSHIESENLAEEKSKNSTVEETKSIEDVTVSPADESKLAEDKPVADSPPVTENKEVEESKTEENKTTETSKTEENSCEPQVNGKSTNGDSETKMNGDSKEEELCSRLSVENGKEGSVNGSNGDSMDAEQGQGDNKVEEIADIKAKTVAAVDPPAEPIDQPTEA